MAKEKQSLAQELSTISDDSKFTAQGKQYTVHAMPITYVREYLEERIPLITSRDGNVQSVMTNFTTIPLVNEKGETVNHDMEAVTDKWVQRLIYFEGQPCTLSMLKSHNWNIKDFDEFLKKALAISG